MPDPTPHGNHDPCPACELRATEKAVQVSPVGTSGSLFCTVCAYAKQPAGKPCKLCGRTDAPERKP